MTTDLGHLRPIPDKEGWQYEPAYGVDPASAQAPQHTWPIRGFVLWNRQGPVKTPDGVPAVWPTMATMQWFIDQAEQRAAAQAKPKLVIPHTVIAANGR